jgi:septum formation inhibitor MinC
MASSVASSKAHTKHNQLISAIESSLDSTSTVFATFLQQCQMAEEFEWRQCHMDCEEEHAGCEEESHEMRRKESRQLEQLATVMQMAITGMMAYLGAKKPRNDQEPPLV